MPDQTILESSEVNEVYFRIILPNGLIRDVTIRDDHNFNDLIKKVNDFGEEDFFPDLKLTTPGPIRNNTTPDNDYLRQLHNWEIKQFIKPGHGLLHFYKIIKDEDDKERFLLRSYSPTYGSKPKRKKPKRKKTKRKKTKRKKSKRKKSKRRKTK